MRLRLKFRNFKSDLLLRYKTIKFLWRFGWRDSQQKFTWERWKKQNRFKSHHNKWEIKIFKRKVKLFPLYQLNDIGLTVSLLAIWIGTNIGIWGPIGYAMAWVAVYGSLTAAMWGASSLLSSLGQKKPTSNFSSGGLLINSSNATDVKKVIYGKTRVGGSRVFVHTTGTTNRDLHIIVVWGTHKVKGIYVDGTGEQVWLGEQREQYYQTYKGLNLVFHEFHNGSADQTVSATLPTYFASWADAHRRTVYSYFRLKYHATAWVSLPDFTTVIEGRDEIYDPRDGSIGYSRNPALIARDFFTHPLYGGGMAGNLVNKQSIIDSANWCDNAAAGRIPFYFDGAIANYQEFLNNLEALLLNFHADFIWSGGEWKLIVSSYSASVMELTEVDIKEDPNRKNSFGIMSAGIQNNWKYIKGVFCDPVDNYIPKYCYWPQDPPAGDADVDATFEFIGTVSFEQCLKLLKYYFLRKNFSNVFSFSAHPRTLALEKKDMIQITHDTLQTVRDIPSTWNDYLVRVQSIEIDQADQIILTCLDESSTIYDETVNIAVHVAYSTTLPTAGDAEFAPTNLTATTGEDQNTPSATDAHVVFSWDNVRPGADYRLRWRKSTVSHWKYEPINDPGDIGEWLTLYNYGLGDFCYPTVANTTGKYYEVTVDAGSSGAIEPVWPIIDGNTVVDGGLTWTCRAANRIKLRIGKFECDPDTHNGVIIYWEVMTLGIGKLADSAWAIPGAPVTTWAPSTPAVTGVTLTVTGQEKFILLSWTDPTSYEYNIFKWQIYRGTTAVFGAAALLKKEPATKREYKDSQVSKGILYYYWLKIENKNGLVSAEIGPSTGQLTDPETPGPPIFIPDVIPPTPNPPTGMNTGAPALQATGSDKYECNISWDICIDESGDVTYTIWWWKDGTTNYHKHGEIKDLTFTLTNLEAGFTYHWKVLAADAHNNKTSFCADQDIVVGNVLATPDGMSSATGLDEATANLNDAYIDFTWNRVAGLDYELRWKKAGGGYHSHRIEDPGSGATITYRVGKLPINTSHLWNVRAVKGTLQSAWCAEQTRITQAAAAPNAPTNVKLYVKPGQFEIALTEVVGTDVAMYPIYINTANDSGTAEPISSIIRGKSKTVIPIGSKSASITIGYNVPYYFWATTVNKWNTESAKVACDPTNDMILKTAELLHYQKPWKLRNLQHIRKYIAEDTDDTYTVPNGKVALITRYNLVRGGVGGTGAYIMINDEIIDTAISAGSPILRNSKWTYGIYVEFGDHIDIHTGNSAGSTAEVRVDEFDADSDIVVQALFVDGATIYTVPASKHGLLVFAYDVEGSPSVQLLVSIDGGANYYDLMAIGLEKFDATAGCMQLETGYKLKSSSAVDLWITIIEIPD